MSFLQVEFCIFRKLSKFFNFFGGMAKSYSVKLKVLRTGEGSKKSFLFFFAYCVVYVLLCCYSQNNGSVIASF